LRMEQKALAVLVAMGLVLFCAARVSAQEMINMKAGSFRRWSAQDIEQELGMEKIESLAVTLPPSPGRGVIFLDGRPLKTGRVLNRTEIDRIWQFTSSQCDAVPIGITVFPDPPLDRQPKIRCINRLFSPILKVYQPISKEE